MSRPRKEHIRGTVLRTIYSRFFLKTKNENLSSLNLNGHCAHASVYVLRTGVRFFSILNFFRDGKSFLNLLFCGSKSSLQSSLVFCLLRPFDT